MVRIAGAGQDAAARRRPARQRGQDGAVADGKLKDRQGEQGLDVVGSSSAEMLAVMTADTKKWSEVIAATGAKVPQ